MRIKSKISSIYRFLKKNVYSTEILKDRTNKTLPVESLDKFDIVSFDVFDTIVLRDVVSISDVYSLVGLKLGLNNFSEIRFKAERYAQLFKFGDTNHDVTIFNIYDVIERWTGLQKEKGIEAEIEIEKSLCHMNTAFKRLVLSFCEKSKKIIFTTDMYFPASILKEILIDIGLKVTPELYISCECNASKRDGDLFTFIRKKKGETLSYIHIGNDKKSDVLNAKKAGWKAFYYKCPASIGNKFKSISDTRIQDSINGGIINRFLYTRNSFISKQECFGFAIFGNLFVSYCKWIENIAKVNNIQKIFFLARDGYLLKQIFDKYIHTIPTEYLIVSRFALCQITVRENIESFLHENIASRLHSHITIEKLFTEIGLEDFLNQIDSVGFLPTDILSDKNFDKVACLLRENRSTVAQCYSNSIEGASVYFTEAFKNCKSALIVDVGWYSTCFLNIKNFLEGTLGLKIHLLASQIGIQCNNINRELVNSGLVFPFVFSPDYNKALFSKHNTRIGNVLMEIAFSAPKPSLRNYVLNDDGTISFNYQTEPNANIDIVTDVQSGILKYADAYFNFEHKSNLKLNLSGESSYLKFNSILRKKKYINKLFGNYATNQSTAGSMTGAKNFSKY